LQIGFEIWTMQNDILFDNIYIGHSIEDAEKLRKETFDVKHPVEIAEEEALKPKPEEKDATPSVSFREDPVAFVREKVDHFVGLAKQDPVGAVKQVPEVAGGLVAVVTTMILIIVTAIGASSPAPAPAKKGKEAAGAGKEKAGEGTSSSADTGKGGATKRNTRSAE
jgi:calnexin